MSVGDRATVRALPELRRTANSGAAFGIQVETVGFGIDRYDGLGELDQQHPAKLLQEVRSTIRAARALLERIEAGERMATDPRR